MNGKPKKKSKRGVREVGGGGGGERVEIIIKRVRFRVQFEKMLRMWMR